MGALDPNLACDLARAEDEVQAHDDGTWRVPAADWVTPKRERPRCGARTRTGAPCQARAVWDDQHDRPRTRRGRCRMHGGLSTGPKTEAGKAAARAALDRINAERRAAAPA